MNELVLTSTDGFFPDDTTVFQDDQERLGESFLQRNSSLKSMRSSSVTKKTTFKFVKLLMKEENLQNQHLSSRIYLADFTDYRTSKSHLLELKSSTLSSD